MDPNRTENWIQPGIHCSAEMLTYSCSIWAVVKFSILGLLPFCAALNSEGSNLVQLILSCRLCGFVWGRRVNRAFKRSVWNLTRMVIFAGLALADFRNKVLDPGRVLRSWNLSDESPCKWRGIVCDNVTNQVIKLYQTYHTSC